MARHFLSPSLTIRFTQLFIKAVLQNIRTYVHVYRCSLRKTSIFNMREAIKENDNYLY